MNIILTASIIIIFFIFLVIMHKKKSKLGINLNRVYCPICNTKQPVIRIPANANQVLFGGTTCPKCQAQLDKYGKVIS